jgi:hypothetical protein
MLSREAGFDIHSSTSAHRQRGGSKPGAGGGAAPAATFFNQVFGEIDNSAAHSSAVG